MFDPSKHATTPRLKHKKRKKTGKRSFPAGENSVSTASQAPTVPVKVRIKKHHQTSKVLLVAPLPQNIPGDLKAHYKEFHALPERIIEH